MYREYMLEVGKALNPQEHLTEMREEAKTYSEVAEYLDALMQYFGNAFTTIFQKEEEFYQSFKLSIERGADASEAGSLLGNGFAVTEGQKGRDSFYMGLLSFRDKMATALGFSTAELMMPELPQVLQGANEIEQAVYSLIDTFNTAAKDEMVGHLQYFENQIGIDVEVIKLYLRQLQEWLSMAKRAIKDYYDTMIQQLSHSQV